MSDSYPHDSTAGPADVIDTGPDAPRGRRRGLAIALLAAGLVVAVGVGAFAVVRNVVGGFGDRPEAVVPANALAFVRLDLDPQAGEKLDALRFLRKFDALKADLPSESGDLRKWAVEQFGEGEVTWADVEPWIGDRYALAILPAAKGQAEPGVVAVLQSTDDGAASTSLRRLTAGSDDTVYAVRDGWAFLSDSQAALDAATRDTARLAGSKAYQDALEGVGDESLLVGYANLDGLGRAIARAPGDLFGSDSPVGGSPSDAAAIKQVTDSLKGTVAFGMQFEPDHVELKAVGQGMSDVEPVDVDPKATLAQAPRGALAALQLAYGDDSISKGWQSFLKQMAGVSGGGSATVEDQLAQIEQQTGIKLPEDLQTLLGSGLVAAVDPEGLTTGAPKAGALIRTDADTADAVVQKVLDLVARQGVPVPDGSVARVKDGDTYKIGTDKGYLERFGSGATLGDDPRVAAAVADASDAQLAAWVDLDAVYRLMLESEGPPGGDDADVAQALEALDGVGLSVTSDTAGSVEFTLRVTAD